MWLWTSNVRQALRYLWTAPLLNYALYMKIILILSLVAPSIINQAMVIGESGATLHIQQVFSFNNLNQLCAY